MHFLAYFQKIGCGAESLVKLGSLLWESSENKFGRPKKRSTKFFRILKEKTDLMNKVRNLP